MSTPTQNRPKINDIDSHEMIPAPLWGEHFGEQSGRFAKLLRPMSGGGANDIVSDVKEDNVPIDETVWKAKGSKAPGSIDQRRRLEVMDVMGVDKMLLFGSGPGLFGGVLGGSPREILMEHYSDRLGAAPEDLAAFAPGLVSEHNDWCMRVGKLDDRLRPVAYLLTGDINATIAEAERVIDGGIKAFVIPTATPPNGVSPAHPSIDPFWKLLSDRKIPVIFHSGGHFGFIANEHVWRDAPQFKVTAHSDEIGLDSQSFSVFHYAPQNFLSTMILGGVFDRHPNLYVGIIEYGGSWIGPMAENVQQWHNHFGRKAAQKLERPIYDYIRDHVRTSLMYFEEPDKYINRFGLEEVYCYASDYPHLEGGTNPVERITERLSGFGEETWQRVFVKNAELMFPA